MLYQPIRLFTYPIQNLVGTSGSRENFTAMDKDDKFISSTK